MRAAPIQGSITDEDTRANIKRIRWTLIKHSPELPIRRQSGGNSTAGRADRTGCAEGNFFHLPADSAEVLQNSALTSFNFSAIYPPLYSPSQNQNVRTWAANAARLQLAGD
jgi:hypothetical protein